MIAGKQLQVTIREEKGKYYASWGSLSVTANSAEEALRQVGQRLDNLETDIVYHKELLARITEQMQRARDTPEDTQSVLGNIEVILDGKDLVLSDEAISG